MGLAQEHPESSAAARAAYDDGVAAYDAGRYREAVELFKQADRLSPSPRLSFNIAKVYERMGDHRSALAAYRDYARRLPSADNHAEVARRIEELQRSLADAGVQQVSISSSPAGATVVVDEVSRGLTPWTGELTPGRHALTLRLSGHAEAVTEFELPAERAIDVTLELDPVTARAPTAAGAESSTAADSLGGEASAPGATAQGSAAAPAAPQSAALSLPVASASAVPRWWTWALFGGSAAALTGAGLLELSRSGLEEQAGRSDVQLDHYEKFEAMQGRQTAARVFLGAGVAAAVAGAVSLWFDHRRANAAPESVALDCGRRGCVLQAGGQF